MNYSKIIVDLLIGIGAILFLSNLSYIGLIISSFRVFRRNKFGWNYVRHSVKPISLIVPAYNEERNILESLKSFLSQKYDAYEIILINDGSKDSTLQLILDNYPLTSIKFDPTQFKLCKAKVRAVYVSEDRKLTVVDKENGGKSDALNAGIDLSKYDYFCSVDADSIIDHEAFKKVMTEFELNSDLIACGATVRVANGSRIKNGKVLSESLPQKYIELCQELEYTRSFLMGRVGWELFQSTMIISGAFGLFHKPSILQINGFDIDSIGEDMDLIIRLHKHFLKEKKSYKIGFIPDPLCWTEVPNSYAGLASQRNRWQRGLLSSILGGKGVVVSPEDNIFAKLSIPYYILTEIFSPIIEVASYILIGAGIFIGIISLKIAALFFIVSILFSMILSLAALMYEEKYFSKKLDKSSIGELILISFLENFGFRQFMVYQRIKGIIDYYLKRSEWGTIERHGISVRTTKQ